MHNQSFSGAGMMMVGFAVGGVIAALAIAMNGGTPAQRCAEAYPFSKEKQLWCVQALRNGAGVKGGE